MTIVEAKRVIEEYESNYKHTEEDDFQFVEALQFLIEKTNDSRAVLTLGGFYYEKKDFELARKYYELAAEEGNVGAFVCLGYIWYYGRTGTKDYEKAFEYFSKAAEKGDFNAEYKVADMYKNGYGTDADYEKYKSIIESLYKRIQKGVAFDYYTPEINTRLANIRKKEGKTEEAIELLLDAKHILEFRIADHQFFGDLTIMKYLIRDLYSMKELNENELELYDLYYVFTKPCTAKFRLMGTEYEIEAVQEEDGISIKFNDKWFRNIDDFFTKAEVGGEKLITMVPGGYIL